MTLEELKERQGWTLDQKIDHSLATIDQFIQRLGGVENVYVGFSGGKDSTVLLDLCRVINPNIKAVFCNTGNEYPDIVRFVRELKATEGYNIEIIHPELPPHKVMSEYGFPLISKEVSKNIHAVETNPNSIQAKRALGIIKRKYKALVPIKYRFLVDEDFSVSDSCCRKLKKEPFHKYEKEHHLAAILGIMASESNMRRTAYINRGGCNVFSEDNPTKSKSLPLSIWLEDDIWAYIKKRNLKIADIYNKGAMRTGCMFCGYGCQFKDDNRLELVHKLYPKWYDRFMGYTNNGVTYREAMRKVLAVNGLYLPDEKPAQQLSLFEE